MINTASERRN